MEESGQNNSKSWLAENVNEMDGSVQKILKLIEEDDYCLASEKRPELISHVREFHQIYQSLVENCNRFAEDLSNVAPSEKVYLECLDNFESSCGLETPFFTPNQKLRSNMSGDPNASVEISFSSGGCSVVSSKEATELSSSDSEADSTNSSFSCDHGPSVNNNRILHVIDETKAGFTCIKEQHQMADVDKINTIMSLAESNEEKCEESLKISIENEELRDMKLKLELSENEVCRLKSELEKCEPVFQHAKNLENQLESVKKDLEMTKTALELENEKVIELKKQTAYLETHVPGCCNKNAKLTDELEEARESLKTSEGEIMRLHREADLDREKNFDLSERVALYEARLSELVNEVQTLKATVSAKQEQYSFESEQLQSENFTLSEEVILLNSRINDFESRSNAFEEKLARCEKDKLEMEESKTSQEMVLQDEISCLREELHKRRYQVEGLNKEFDRHKHKYDMLMIERDEFKAHIHKLLANVSSRDDKVLDLERQIYQLHVEQDEVISASRITESAVTELKLQVDELQKDLACKRVEISDGAEAKREAIRQLCFSLDHYRTIYEELRQEVTSKKRHVVPS